MNDLQKKGAQGILVGIIASIIAIFAVKEYQKRKKKNEWHKPS